MATKPSAEKLAVQRSKAKQTVRKNVKRTSKRASTSTRQIATTIPSTTGDLSQDVLHGSMKPLIYAAVMKRLHTNTNT